MRIGFVRHGLIVLSAIYGICISQSAISQPGADFDVVEATIGSIQAAIRSGGLSCTKLVQKYLDRIAAYDQAGPKLNAVQNVNPHALQRSEERRVGKECRSRWATDQLKERKRGSVSTLSKRTKRHNNTM